MATKHQANEKELAKIIADEIRLFNILKTTMKKYIFILMAAVLGIAACNERELLDQQTRTTDFDNSSIASMSSTRVLTNAQIESIASMHNTYLAEVEPNLDWTASDMYAEIESDFMAVNSNGLTLSTSEKSDYLDFNLDETDGYNFLSQNLSSSAINIIDDAKDYVNNTSNFNFSDLQSEISSLESDANTQLVGEELDAVLIYLAVLEKSAHHWMPVDRGGSGDGTPTVANASVRSNMAAWERCLLADATAAATVFTGIGLTLLATPTATALIAAVGWSAGCASLWALI